MNGHAASAVNAIDGAYETMEMSAQVRKICGVLKAFHFKESRV
jgi:tellurite resistance protein